MYILFSFVGGVGGVCIAGSALDLFGNTSFEKVDVCESYAFLLLVWMFFLPVLDMSHDSF